MSELLCELLDGGLDGRRKVLLEVGDALVEALDHGVELGPHAGRQHHHLGQVGPVPQARVNVEQGKVNEQQHKVNDQQRRVSAVYSGRIEEILESAVRRHLAQQLM